LEDKIPRLEKFCFCMDVKTGVKVGAIVLIIWYVIILIGGVTVSSNTGNSVFSVIFTLINIAVFGCVLFGLHKNNPKFLIPAIVLCLIDVIIGIIWGIILFVTLFWLSAIFTLLSAFLTAYYFVALKNVYDDMGGTVPAPAAPVETKPENPA